MSAVQRASRGSTEEPINVSGAWDAVTRTFSGQRPSGVGRGTVDPPLFLPSDSPNLNRIERLWGGTKRRSVCGRYHPDFASFRTASEGTIAGIPMTHANTLESLMTLKFQTFEDVSLLTA